MASSIDKVKVADRLREAFGDVVTRSQLVEWCEANNEEVPHWLANNKAFRSGRGAYRIPQASEIDASVDAPVTAIQATGVESVNLKRLADATESYVPDSIDNYVAFGNHADVKTIIESGKFASVYITGLSGCGKTSSVIQVCSELGRELLRCNITQETEEGDLVGDFRLINGDTAWFDGPVVRAMKRGAVLLLDEIDLASDKILCLQAVLEGKPVQVLKTGEVVRPAPGFCVFATGNTKGQGDDSGKFIGTRPLNESMIERFKFWMEQEYPPAKVEEKILNRTLESLGTKDEQFSERLVTWAGAIRSAYNDGAVDEIITTRRLIDCVTAFVMFKDRSKAIQMVISRFNADTRQALQSLYEKVDDTIRGKAVSENIAKTTTIEVADNEIPF